MASRRPRTIFLLRLLQLNLYNMLVDRLSAFEVKPAQYMVLSIVASRGSWSTAELARRFHIAPQSMNEVVASLERRRLIERRESAAHRRIRHIRLTTSGLRLIERCDRAVDRIERAAFKEFAPAELGLFRDLLSRALLKFDKRAASSARGARDRRTSSSYFAGAGAAGGL